MQEKQFEQPAATGAHISLIVATDENDLMGAGDKLPWTMPADMRFFKNKTWGTTVVMGRKTFAALGKALPGRHNIVITRNAGWQAAGVQVAHSLQAALEAARELGAKETFVIGGAEIFELTLPLAHTLYRTRIHHCFEGDVYFPPFSNTSWHLAQSHTHPPDEKNKWPYTFETWAQTPEGR